MTPDASFYQFSEEVWQAVNFQVRRTLARKEFCPEQSRVDSVHCEHLEDETEFNYGRQVWFFDAIGVDPVGRHQRVYGALEFAVQYGLLEPARAVLMDEPLHRQRFLQSIVRPTQADVWASPSSKLWVRLTLLSVIIASGLWLVWLGVSLMG